MCALIVQCIDIPIGCSYLPSMALPVGKSVYLQAALCGVGELLDVAVFSVPPKAQWARAQGRACSSLQRTLPGLRIFNLLLLFGAVRQLHALRVSLGQELGDALLVDLVFGVFACAQELGEPRASLEEDEIAESTAAGPVEKRVSLQAAPLVQAHPEGLLGRKVGVTGPAEEACSVEAAVELGASVALLGLSGLLVSSFCFVKVPLLSVSDVFDGDQSDEEAGNDDFDGVHGWV